MHEGKVLIHESYLGRLYVYWEEYGGTKFLHIRYWYQDKKDGMWKPGVKGIGIPRHLVAGVLQGLRDVLDQIEKAEQPAPHKTAEAG